MVHGRGDPNLSGRFFDGDPDQVLRIIARDVAAQGVKHVRGGLVIDDSRFDRVYVHPDWPDDQLDRWYAAPVGALVFNDSCWDITVLPGGNPGDPARLKVKPGLLQARIDNSCRTVDGMTRCPTPGPRLRSVPVHRRPGLSTLRCGPGRR